MNRVLFKKQMDIIYHDELIMCRDFKDISNSTFFEVD